MNITKKLFEMQDKTYKSFSAKLIPNVDEDTVIGVRAPSIKALAKQLDKDDKEKFLSSLPHKYLEENHLHAYLISLDNEYASTVKELDRFLPFIDNWATCDGIRPKCFNKHKTLLLEDIKRWINSGRDWTVRFAIEMLMTYYLDGDFKYEYAEIVANVKSNEYYVNMMIAWYFATALAKQYDSVIGFLENKTLSPWTHNKTIQKSIESFRISNERKQYLRSLKIK